MDNFYLLTGFIADSQVILAAYKKEALAREHLNDIQFNFIDEAFLWEVPILEAILEPTTLLDAGIAHQTATLIDARSKEELINDRTR